MRKRSSFLLFLLVTMSIGGSFSLYTVENNNSAVVQSDTFENDNSVVTLNEPVDGQISEPLPSSADWGDPMEIGTNSFSAKLFSQYKGVYQGFFSVDDIPDYTERALSDDGVNWEFSNKLDLPNYQYFRDVAYNNITNEYLGTGSGDLYTVSADGSVTTEGTGPSMNVDTNNAFIQGLDGTFYVKYSYGSPLKIGKIQNNVFTSHIDTGLTGSYTNYDLLQYDLNTWMIIYRDSTDNYPKLQISSSIEDWSGSYSETVIQSATFYPLKLFNYQRQLVLLFYKSDNQMYYQTSDDLGASWSTETLFSNRQYQHQDFQLFQYDDGSWGLVYQNSGTIYLIQTQKELTLDIIKPNNINTEGNYKFSSLGQFANTTSLANIETIWQFYYPNETLWFMWTQISNSTGHSEFSLNLDGSQHIGNYILVVTYNLDDSSITQRVEFVNTIPYMPPIFIEFVYQIVSSTISIESGTLKVVIISDSTIFIDLWYVLSVLDPNNVAYRSKVITKAASGTFEITITLDLVKNQQLTQGEYTGQLIVLNGSPEISPDVVDYIEFTTTVS